MDNELKEYNLYAGLGGGFGGASYQYTGLFKSLADAEHEAYELAISDYDSYEESHGLLTYEEAEEEAYANLPDDATESEIESYIDELFCADRETWCEYWAVLTSEDTDTEESKLIRNYIENSDSSGEVSSETE